jgi:hypothetical protein
MPGVVGMPPAERRCPATVKNGPRRGEQCSHWLPLGWRVCRYHGGATKAHRAQAAKRRVALELEAELGRVGVPIEGANAIEVLRSLVAEWAGTLAFWRAQVQRLQDAGRAESADPTFPYKAGTVYEKYSQASDRLAHYSKLAIEAGLDEAETALISKQGELLARVLQRYAAAMGVANDPRSAPAMRAALELVTSDGVDRRN